MKYYAANWKMNKGPKETREFFAQLKALMPKQNGSRVLIFPPTLCIEAALQANQNSEWIVGLQNCYFENSGAFTGENSASEAFKMGATASLVGHSERRTLFGEQDDLLARKVKYLQDLKMLPVFCFGETLPERQSGKTKSVLDSQLQKGIALADKNKALVVAYEPVWAIGTGQVASVDQVKEAHAWVRAELTRLGFSDKTAILYGGSVKADNAGELIQIPNVDGFLIGGASLVPETFAQICKA